MHISNENGIHSMMLDQKSFLNSQRLSLSSSSYITLHANCEIITTLSHQRAEFEGESHEHGGKSLQLRSRKTSAMLEFITTVLFQSYFMQKG